MSLWIKASKALPCINGLMEGSVYYFPGAGWYNTYSFLVYPLYANGQTKVTTCIGNLVHTRPHIRLGRGIESTVIGKEQVTEDGGLDLGDSFLSSYVKELSIHLYGT